VNSEHNDSIFAQWDWCKTTFPDLITFMKTMKDTGVRRSVISEIGQRLQRGVLVRKSDGRVADGLLAGRVFYALVNGTKIVADLSEWEYIDAPV